MTVTVLLFECSSNADWGEMREGGGGSYDGAPRHLTRCTNHP